MPAHYDDNKLLCFVTFFCFGQGVFINEGIELLKQTEGTFKKYKFKITSHLIHFYGLCDKYENK